MSNDKKLGSQYLKEVSSKLDCPKSVKSFFLTELKENILSFSTQKLDMTKDALYAEFGTPEEIADGFFDRGDYKTLLAKAKKDFSIGN